VPAMEFRIVARLTSALQVFVFCLAFRVWDDLEDRRADRGRHPERVMSLAATTSPFVGLVAALAVTGCVLLSPAGDLLRRFAALGLAVAVLSVWYAGRPSENWNRLAGEHIVLLKYPLIAYAAAPSLPSDVVSWRALGVLSAVYATVCAYDYADDPELRHILVSRRSIS
jgi:4-hydroxybenzoate polyprenyltransferase